MGLFRRRKAEPPARIAIRLPEPAEQILLLRPLVDRLTEVVHSLAGDVATLRQDLALLRPETAGESTGQLRPAAAAPAVFIGSVTDEAAELQRVFEILNEQTDALWFERQWLQAQFTVAWEGVPLPGHPRIS
jgi:hypothetical protein